MKRKELLAVVSAVKYFDHYLHGGYLHGGRALIRTDHRALRCFINFRNPEGQLAR